MLDKLKEIRDSMQVELLSKSLSLKKAEYTESKIFSVIDAIVKALEQEDQDKKYFWEIYVPTQMERDGKISPIRTRYHRVWDDKVRAISNGLTILQPVKGQWIDPTGQLFAEKMIPVRIICTKSQILQIAEMTKVYYNQQAVLFFKVSDDTQIV